MIAEEIIKERNKNAGEEIDSSNKTHLKRASRQKKNGGTRK
jgi:hypothetical protein